MYKRKIDSLLTSWKQTDGHKPLIIKGCRQCGKTSSVRQFADQNYQHVVYIDFHEHPELTSLFNASLQVDYLITMLSATSINATFVPQQTCIIFDEVQECPNARASLKFWKQDGRYDVICTGSLLGVSGYVTTNTSIPVGAEQIIEMYPMDFEEWLWANGISDEVIQLLRQYMTSNSPVPEILHNRLRTLFKQYVIVGGMPEVVTTFLTTHDVKQMCTLQRTILAEYTSDMVKYAPSYDKVRIRECFQSIPMQLSKEQKKFQYSVVRRGGRSKEYIGSLQWIEDAGIIQRCYNTSIPTLPLDGNVLRDEFKVYMVDTGLFTAMLDTGTQGDILCGKMDAYKGAIYENVVADILGKMGRPLYYFRKDSGLEIDFLLRYKGECVPLECKATTGRAKSLRTVVTHPEKYALTKAIKVGDYNVGCTDWLLTLPLYMTFLLTDI